MCSAGTIVPGERGGATETVGRARRGGGGGGDGARTQRPAAPRCSSPALPGTFVAVRAPHHPPCPSFPCAHLSSFGGPSECPRFALSRSFLFFFLSCSTFPQPERAKYCQWLHAALACVPVTPVGAFLVTSQRGLQFVFRGVGSQCEYFQFFVSLERGEGWFSATLRPPSGQVAAVVATARLARQTGM